MAIKPKCDKCKKELVEYGAILLSPPDGKDSVRKFHICIHCFKDILNDIEKETNFTNEN